MRNLIIAALIVAAPLAAAQTPAATPERTAAPTAAEVYIVSPKDGATVHNPVLVQFGLKGMASPRRASSSRTPAITIC